MAGSTLFAMTWKRKVTPAGRFVFRLQASVPRTSDNGSGLWPNGWTTPQAHDVTGRSRGQKAIHGTKHGCACLVREAEMASWPSPRAENSEGGRDPETVLASWERRGRVTTRLDDYAALATWPSPRVTDDNMDRRSDAAMEREWVREDRGENLALTARMATWPTPKVSDDNVSRLPPEAMQRWLDRPNHGSELAAVATLASWATPTTRDHKDGSSYGTAPINALLGRQAWLSAWPTPMSGTPSTEEYNAAGSTDYERKVDTILGIRETVNGPKHAAWATPTTESKGGSRGTPGSKAHPGWTITDQLHGTITGRSPAETAKLGSLNPALSRWLMGYPAAWDACAPVAFKWQRKARTTKTCESCGTLLSRKLNVYRRKYCNQQCMAKAFTKTPKDKPSGRWQAQHLYPTHHCERCGIVRDELHRHHLDQNPTNNAPENIQVLCRACHHAVHRELATAAANSQKSIE